MRKGLSKKVICLVTLITTTTSTLAFAQDIKKDETVYVILDENGNSTEQIVSDWISSPEVLGEFKDKSNLEDIKNVKGSEEPVRNGDELTWNIPSENLYYQGTSNKELPISISIKYKFNNKEVNPNDVLGKEGKFKISISLKNNESETKVINGKSRKLYVPFLTAGGITLSNTNFSNLKVSSGKIINDGSNSLVSFVALPGLKESLNIDDLLGNIIDTNEISLEDTIEIEGDTSNFEVPTLMMAATTVTSGLDEIKGMDKVGELKASLEELKNGGEELLDGSKKLLDGQTKLANNYSLFNDGVNSLSEGAYELSNGLNQLNEKVPTLVNGVSELNSGAAQVKEKYGQFDAGVTSIASGAESLKDGVNEVNNNMSSLSQGAENLNNGLNDLNTAESQFNTGLQGFLEKTNELRAGYDAIDTGINNAYTGAKNLSLGLSQGSTGVETLIASTDTLANISVQLDQIALALESSDPETSAQISALSKGINDISVAQKGGLTTLGQEIITASEGATQLESGLGELSNGSTSFKTNFDTLIGGGDTLSSSSQKIGEGILNLYNGSITLKNGVVALESGIGALAEGSNTLANGANELNSNSKLINNAVGQLYDGTTALANGSDTLQNGVKALADGGNSLKEGANTLNSNSSKILEGTEELESGTSSLFEGVTKLKEEGLDKINEEGNAVIDGIEDIADVKDELIKMSKEYGIYSGLPSEMDGSVKFIIRSESTESTKETSNKEVSENKEKPVSPSKKESKSLFSRIKEIFS